MNATAQGVSKSIRKMKDLGILIEADGGHRNRAQRLTPNFALYVNGYSVASAVNGYAVDATLNGHSVAVPTTVIELPNTLVNRSYTKGSGTYKAAGAKRAPRLLLI